MIAVAVVLSFASCARQQESPIQQTTNPPAAPPATLPASTTASAPAPAPAPSPVTPAAQCTPKAMTLCPVDEGAGDAAFADYRARLLDAIERRDEKALLPLIADDIRVSFGAGGGIVAFRKHWKTSSSDSPLWAELSAIVRNGGSFMGEGTNRMFWAPYVYSRWPEDVDAFEHLAATRAGVALRAKADESAAQVATLDWSIVRILDPGANDAPWRHVRTQDGKEGWVSAKDVRSPIGYRAGFKEVNGAWKMNALVAGD